MQFEGGWEIIFSPVCVLWNVDPMGQTAPLTSVTIVTGLQVSKSCPKRKKTRKLRLQNMQEGFVLWNEGKVTCKSPFSRQEMRGLEIPYLSVLLHLKLVGPTLLFAHCHHCGRPFMTKSCPKKHKSRKLRLQQVQEGFLWWNEGKVTCKITFSRQDMRGLEISYLCVL